MAAPRRDGRRGRRSTGTGRTRAAKAAAWTAAAEALRSYADRGVFRAFAIGAAGSGGRRELRFSWLADRVFRVRLDPRARTMTFVEVLPDVPYPSVMDRALRTFLRERSSPDLPDHRRIDVRRVALSCANRGGGVSLRLALRREGEMERADWEYAARRGVSLVNEIFHGFLRGPYHEYMVRHFGEPEE